MALSRRTFLKGTAAAAGAAAALRLPGGRRLATAAPLPPPFVHGVASGDPLPDGVILWTRVTPSADATPGSGRGPALDVRWVVATDPGLRDVVREGTVRTDALRDHTVKVDVRGLQPRTRYFYAFSTGSARSIVGSTRTAPARGTAADLRFALASCSNFEGGHFAGYRGIAERTDLDFVLHVGDYIYEYEVGYYGAGPDIGREHEPANEILSLADYRRRYACYREDPDLRSAHAAHPFILMWDDHEVANDNWEQGAENHDPATQGDFRARYERASQAYREWLPVREHPSDPQRLYRRLELGDLATLHMIDSRSYRSEQTSLPITPEYDPAVDDPNRTILGREQKAWFKAGLSAATTTWQLVGNPQMIAPVLFPPLPQEVLGPIADVTGLLPRDGLGYNSDQWDGYRAARDEILRHLAGEGIDNAVFLTGDIHSSWACDLPINPGGYPLTSPSVATELVGTSITSDNLDEITGSPPRTTSVAVEEAIKASNRHIKLLEFDSHGFSVVDVTRERLQMDWFYLRSTTSPQRPQHDPRAEIAYAQSWKVDEGTNWVTPADGPLPERPGSALRIAGGNRFATAAALSAATFDRGVPVAYVATGEDFPDALAGGVAAARAGAPVLLVGRDRVPPETGAELERLEPGSIVVLGGPAAVSDAVVAELRPRTTGAVTRLAGPSRFATAAAISQAAFAGGAPVAVIATGTAFPDALAGVPAAVAAGGPVLLVTPDQVPGPTAEELRRLRPGTLLVLGGRGAVADGVVAELRRVTGANTVRVAGSDRFGTAVATSRRAFPDGARTAFVATGALFPDALAGGAVAAAAGAPVLLVTREAVPSDVLGEVRRLGAERAVILGGTGAVSRNVELAIGDATAR
jgi:alkaline phosphatase D